MERRRSRAVKPDVEQRVATDEQIERELDELIHEFECLDLGGRVLSEAEKECIRRDITEQLAALLENVLGRRQAS